MAARNYTQFSDSLGAVFGVVEGAEVGHLIGAHGVDNKDGRFLHHRHEQSDDLLLAAVSIYKGNRQSGILHVYIKILTFCHYFGLFHIYFGLVLVIA